MAPSSHSLTAHAEIIYHIMPEKFLFPSSDGHAGAIFTRRNKPEINEKNDHQTIGIQRWSLHSHHRYETFNHYRSGNRMCVQRNSCVVEGVLSFGKGILKNCILFIRYSSGWPFSHPPSLFSLSHRQAEKLAEIYFIPSDNNKFFAWIFFLFRSHFTGFSVE